MNRVLTAKLKEEFRKIYNREDGRMYFAPGRVNLIGEHTDYNGGHVFPCAISMGTYGMIAPRSDGKLRMYSLDRASKGVIEVCLEELAPGRTKEWTGYPEGVFWSMGKRGIRLPHGADLMFAGDVPAGSGLSSSASLEVLTGLMIREMYSYDELSGIDLALIGQNAENEYCGMHCGIMDQFASAMGRKDHAVYLKTDTLDYDLVPLKLQDYELVITNSGVKHSLVSSAYNDRRRECTEALETLKKNPELSNIGSLCELTAEEFEKHCGAIGDPVIRKRAKHAVLENERTVKAVEVLKRDDLISFGKLVNESHVSLRDDFEVSCEEMDYLAEAAWEQPGCLGSRMTGGGFGGCTVSIVKKEMTERFEEEIGRSYLKKYGLKALFYRAMPEEGAHVIDL